MDECLCLYWSNRQLILPLFELLVSSLHMMAPNRDIYVCLMNFIDHLFLHHNPEGSGHFYFLRSHKDKLKYYLFNWIPDINSICALSFHWVLSARSLWEAWENGKGIIHPSRSSQSGEAAGGLAAPFYWRGHLLLVAHVPSTSPSPQVPAPTSSLGFSILKQLWFCPLLLVLLNHTTPCDLVDTKLSLYRWK